MAVLGDEEKDVWLLVLVLCVVFLESGVEGLRGSWLQGSRIHRRFSGFALQTCSRATENACQALKGVFLLHGVGAS